MPNGQSDVGWLWHRRLAHVGMINLQSLIKGDHVVGLSDVYFAKDRVCSACIAGKQHEKQHKVNTISSNRRGLLSSFIWIFLGLHPMIVWVGGGIALSLS